MRSLSITACVASGYVAILTAFSRLATALLVALIRLYQIILGRFLGGQCRFQPTCSNYGLEAIRNCGAIKGLRLTAWRILRCHPWSNGGYDPPPDPIEPPKRSSGT